MSISRFRSFFLATTLVVAGFHSVGAAVIAYTNDFSGTGSNTDLPNEATPADWTITGGVYQFSTSNTTTVASPTSIPITNATGVGFTMQTQFTVTSAGNVNANGITLGFGLFGGNMTFTGDTVPNAYYLADWQVANTSSPGNLRIFALGDTSGFTNTAVSVDDNALSSTLALNVGTTYTLKLVGTYVGSTLNMTLGVFDSTGTTQIGSSATASDTSPLTGTNFGYRNRVGIGGPSAFSANFDNFSIVPEPGSVPLLALSAMSLLFLGRRRRA